MVEVLGRVWNNFRVAPESTHEPKTESGCQQVWGWLPISFSEAPLFLGRNSGC